MSKKNKSISNKVSKRHYTISSQNRGTNKCTDCLGLIEPIIMDDEYLHLKSFNDILKIEDDGDFYKAVVLKNEIRIAVRITNETFSIRAFVCNSSAENKIKEAYKRISTNKKRM